MTLISKVWNYIKLKYFFWNQERQLNKEVRRTVLAVNALRREEQDAIKYAYTEGLAQVSKKVGDIKVKQLEELGDVVRFAEKESKESRTQAEILKDIFVYKTEKAKEAMISDRIEQYYELQNYNEGRQIIKDIKKARKEGNDKLAKELEAQWATKYRRITTH